MIDCRVRKAKKYFIRDCVSQLIMDKKVRKQTIGVISTDSTKDPINIWGAQCLQEISRTVFRMILPNHPAR